MKKLMCRVLKLFCLGIALVSLYQCADNKLNNLLEIIADKQDDSIFEELKDCASLDPEASMILNLKDEIDESQLSLIKLVESQSNSDDLSNTMNFTNYIVKFYAFNPKFSSTCASFKEAIEYLQNFNNSDKENDSEYLGFKRIALNNDGRLLVAQQVVMEQLTAYQECHDVLSVVLEDVLGYVTNKDMKSAAERLMGEDVQKYYIEVAKTLNAYYDFIVSRAESIVDSYKLYKTKTQS